MFNRKICMKETNLTKHSISNQIGRYFLVMIAFASLISAISLGIMWSNKSDAGLVNVAGSLRMQSYRLIYELDYNPQHLTETLAEYQRSLNAVKDHLVFTPDNVQASYQQLQQSWLDMAKYIQTNNQTAYVENIEEYVEQVDRFVFTLQEFAELKLQVAIGVIAVSMILMILLAYFGIWYTRNRIIHPLTQLVTASIQVQNEDFNHIRLNVDEPNELGLLSKSFTQMANELQKLYNSLEQEVENKTRRLMVVNRSLLVLYQCSQILTTKPVSQETFTQVLKNLLDNEHLNGIKLAIYGAEHWNIEIDNAPTQQWQTQEIAIENEKLAELSWKASLACPDERLIQNVSEMIGRSIYVRQVQKQQQQLVLMEERAIIARELHDSLAQSLTFFKIQVSLLKRSIAKGDDTEQQQKILQDLENALNEAYTQLRELLSTFRLTIQEANLTQALEQVLDTLRPQTTAQIRLNCKLPSHLFNAQQQVHALQIVRESVINAIKHAQASEIDVIAETNDDGESCLVIRDNGKGLQSHIQPEGHYGLTIMKERTTELKGEFSIRNHEQGGVEVKVILPNVMGK